MNVPVDLDALLDGCEWVSSDEAAMLGAKAFVGRHHGRIYWTGEGIDDDDLPEDAGDMDAYLPVPHRDDLDFEDSLPQRYAEEHLPQLLDEVESLFHKRGAYSRFKSLLDRAGHLDKWHAYEEAAKEAALTQWCAENGFTATKKAPRR